MRRTFVAAVTVSLVAVLAGLSGSAVATGADVGREAEPQDTVASRRAPRVQNLHLALREGTETEVDVHEDGFGPGDYAVKSNSVYLRAEKIGRLTQLCTLIDLEPAPSLHCSINIVLRTGQVTIQGAFTLADTAPRLAVTGGTGKYQGVHGQLTETGSEDHEANLVTLRLVYPNRR